MEPFNQEINEKEEVFDEVQFDKTPWYVYVIICLSVFFTFYTIVNEKIRFSLTTLLFF